MIRQKHREFARKSARMHWRWNTADLEVASAREPASRLLHSAARDRVEATRRGVKDDLEQKYGSGILTSILVSILLKLAMRWVEEWVKDNLFGSAVPSKYTEVK